MFAGADAVLVPVSVRALRADADVWPPLWHAAGGVAGDGGLADTVIGRSTPATLAAGVATGVTFHPVDAMALRPGAVASCCDLYADAEALGQGCSATR